MFAPLARHGVFVVFLASLAWLAMAVLLFSHSSGRAPTGFWVVCGLAAGGTAVYALVLWLAWRLWPAITELRAATHPIAQLNPARQRWLFWLVVAYGLVVASHFLLLGYVPIVSALSSTTDIGVSLVRQAGYFDLPPLMRYASDYSVKAVGPALLLITYYLRSRLFWGVLLIGVFYSMALFARVLPLMLLSPLLVYMLLSRRWLSAAAVLGLLALMVGALTTLSSISIREDLRETVTEVVVLSEEARSVGIGYQTASKKETPPKKEAPPKVKQEWQSTSALYGIYERALIVPGQVLDQWFYYYERSDLREHGCGYRVLAILQGCEYVHIPSKLYGVFYQENMAQGMKGSLNAALFMTDFANWGYAGLAVSALMGGLLFALVYLIYLDHPLALPMNIPLIVVGMESNLMTAINSGGGWLVMTLFFILFFRLSRQ